MSAHLQWMVVRNCSSFLIKRNKQTYSTEPNNLKARNSFRYNGLIHRKTVGVEPAADGKGVVVVIKRRSGQRKPATSYVRTTINKNARATLSSIRHMIRKNKYRPDLRMLAGRVGRQQAVSSLEHQPRPGRLHLSNTAARSFCVMEPSRTLQDLGSTLGLHPLDASGTPEL
ncbi:ribosomal protein L28 [Homo sapiens]|uniref:Large ribosomal subunit protein eL28 n=1 Tax=Homo sapiens TaxID=9606 RepID=H0YKD8_HUMAN|nr:large ribosomal subunit protein eL28 isoform 6 [Homo sapiens]KAI2593272.1 ribosomal protein L28 [Homo sapiens]KAI4044941.1 ribosomal protein L28 [Homo sapiens]|eukprot:XP_024307404.1 60S ribosomal protein L28 isoform X1 [Homo sapiens]